MKILHFILGKANKDRANGVNQVIAGLAKYSSRLGAEVRVIGKAESVACEGEIVAWDGFSVEAFSSWGQPLRSALADGILRADIVHLHGVYSPWNLLVAHMCEKQNRPYIVTLHDGLAPERAAIRGRLKKHLFHSFVQKRHLSRAAGIHILTEEEGTDLFAKAQPKYTFCIPNGVDLDDYPDTVDGEVSSKKKKSYKIGYLGRLSEEKNLEALCQAFVRANSSGDLHLKLAGPQSEFSEELLGRFGCMGVEGVGAKYGQDKLDFIRSLDLFVHPSLCDVFSIAGMEVMALGTPLLITRTSKASYFYGSGAFYMCEPTFYGLEQGLHQAINECTQWPEMAKKGRRLIESRLNWHSAARDMLEQYDYILERN